MVVVVVVEVVEGVVYLHESHRTGHASDTYAPTDGLVQMPFMPLNTSQLDGSGLPLQSGVVVVMVVVEVDVVDVVVVVVVVAVV